MTTPFHGIVALLMILPKLDKAFVSEVDQFLAELAQQFPTPSASQQAEIDQFHRIFELRDEKQ